MPTGASVIQNEVLNAVKDPSVRVLVAWVPILATDQHTPDSETVALLPDERAAQFWDAKAKLPTLFQKTLGLRSECPAWDVYLLYPPGVKWENEPPKPVYWQHQLGGVTAAPCLESKSFAAELRNVLSKNHLPF